LSCLFGAFVCSHSCSRNFLTTSHIFSESYAWFGSAYFLYDVWSMFVVHVSKIYDKLKMKEIDWKSTNLLHMIPSIDNKQLMIFSNPIVNNEKIPSFVNFIKKTKLMIFHHMFIGFYGLIVISSWRGGLGDCIFSFLFLMEFSTPFVNFRVILSILNLKRSKLYVINGILMILTFLIFRIIMLPYLFYIYSQLVGLSMFRAIIKLPTTCQLSIFALFVPQFYWFYLMLKIALKVN
jgi:hypothetical protein